MKRYSKRNTGPFEQPGKSPQQTKIMNHWDLHRTIVSNPADNMTALSRCPYIGRGLIQGMMEDGNFIQLYWLTGRSHSSQNRVLRPSEDDRRVSTDYADHSKKGGDPDLIIYDACVCDYNQETGMLVHAISNGSQTNRFIEQLRSGRDFPSTNTRELYEPDPSGTSRITGVTIAKKMNVEMWFGVARKSQFGGEVEHVSTVITNHTPGLGHCVVTYADDSPTPDGLIPSYRGSVFPVQLEGKLIDITTRYWDMLGEELRVGLMGKAFHPEESVQPTALSIHNRHPVERW